MPASTRKPPAKKPPEIHLVWLEVVRHEGWPALRLKIGNRSHVMPLHPEVALDLARGLVEVAMECITQDPDQFFEPDEPNKENVS